MDNSTKRTKTGGEIHTVHGTSNKSNPTNKHGVSIKKK